MLNDSFIKKSMDLTITQADNDLWYLEPLWKQIILNEGLSVGKTASWSELEDILKLEVEKRNVVNSRSPYVLNWLYNIISTQIEPTITQEETDYIKAVTEYMKFKHEKQEKE